MVVVRGGVLSVIPADGGVGLSPCAMIWLSVAHPPPFPRAICFLSRRSAPPIIIHHTVATSQSIQLNLLYRIFAEICSA